MVNNLLKQPNLSFTTASFATALAAGAILVSLVGTTSIAHAEPAAPATPPPTKQEAIKQADKAAEVKTAPASFSPVEAMELVRNSNNWLNKNIEFQGTFNSFHSFALDYKPAFRDSKDYLSFLILRPDVSHHEIPLSELKLVFPREKVKELVEIQAGDKLLIRGNVFSVALGDPWVDVSDIVVLEQGAKHKAELAKKKKKEATK